jgi:Mg2+ and Co2+ transporter CorA
MAKQYDIEDDSLEQEIVEERHKENLKAIGKVILAIKEIPKEDSTELKKLIADSRDAINNFVKISGQIGKQEAPQVKIETNQDKVVEAIQNLGTVMKGIGERLTAIEKKEEKPLPVKLQAIRREGGIIDYVIIEYKK